jgi:hypothetical protein
MAFIGLSLIHAVGMAIGYGLDDLGVGVRVPIGSRILTSPCRPLSLVSNVYRWLLPPEV